MWPIPVGCTPPKEVALTMNIRLNTSHTMMMRMPWYIEIYRDLDCKKTCQKKIEQDGWTALPGPPDNPPTHEEAFHSLERAPTVADLGPHIPGSCSPSLVPYETEEDSNPEKDQDQQRMTPKEMETEEPTMMEAPAKKGMGIAVGPGDYQPTPPKCVRADKDSMDG